MAHSPQSTADSNEALRLERCQQRLGYQFQDVQLLEAALTHASGADHRLSSNERLEFLGDAILGLVVCEQLFTLFPDQLEGDLTKLKSVVVSRQTCAKISQALGLREFLVLGKGMTTHPAVPPSVLSDVLESLIAAIYLDGGMAPAREFILAYFDPEIESAASGDSGGNYKSLLQQFAQREHGVTPTYHMVDEKGPDHSKCFKMSAQIGRERYAPAWGRSKKESEQRAAHNAICQLRGDEVPYPSDETADEIDSRGASTD
jgi:ribonuclease III